MAGRSVALVRFDEQVFALGDRCSHADYSLSKGEVDERDLTIECWKHGASFSLKDGAPQSLPATKPVPVYDVVVEAGTVYVDVTNGNAE